MSEGKQPSPVGEPSSQESTNSTMNTPTADLRPVLPKTRTEGSADQSYQFAFIDVTSKDARKNARSHVMREFMRQKRGDDDDIVALVPAPARRNTLPRSESTSTEGRKSIDAARSPTPPLSQSRRSRKKRSTEVSDSGEGEIWEVRNRQLVTNQRSPTLRTSRSQSPRGPLDCGKRDPFEMLPMRLDEDDIHLVDHYITVVPELMCNFKGMRMKSGTTATNFNPTRDIILPQAMNNPVTFQATALAFAAGHLARLHGKVNTPQSEKHRIQTLRKLREHFFGQKTHSDDLDMMVAMLSLASCEDRFGDNTAAWIHMRGCIGMLEALLRKMDWRRDRRLYTYMNWVLITMTGYDPCAARVLGDKAAVPQLSFLTSSPLHTNKSRSRDISDTLAAIQEFIDFLTAAHNLNRTAEVDSSSRTTSRRSTMFQSGTPLHKLLTSVPGPRPGVRSINIQKACRFACTLHLNAVLLQLLPKPEIQEAYLKRLSISIIEQELDWNESTETLMWILLFGTEEGEEQFQQSHLVWWVGRMVNVAKRLSDETWAEVGTEMVNCLTRENEKDGFEKKIDGWRRELMDSPFCSHPALQRPPEVDNG